MKINNNVLERVYESDILNGCVTLPESLTHIGGGAFRGCTGLRKVTFKKFKHSKTYKTLCADGMLVFVKKQRHFNGDTEIYCCEFFGGIENKQIRLKDCYVAEKTGAFAHGETVQAALSDLRFKLASDRGAQQCSGIDKDKQLSFEDAVAMYRIITGACQFGTQEFITRLETVKQTYSVNEILELTRGQYGHSAFVDFFERG